MGLVLKIDHLHSEMQNNSKPVYFVSFIFCFVLVVILICHFHAKYYEENDTLHRCKKQTACVV